MRASRTATLCLIGLLLSGCRSGGNSELLERELRCQEDAIYELEDALADCEAVIESGRRENEALKHELADHPGREPVLQGPPTSPRSRLAPPPIDITPPGRRPSRPIGPSEQPKLEVPKVELPGASSDSSQPGPLLGVPTAADSRPVRLMLNPRLTGGLNHDGQPGDEGIMVVFEPQNAAGQLIAPVGDISVVVIDPAEQGAQARVARWDFTHDEAAAHFKKTALGRGYHFALPWPSQLPTHRRLQLFVRLATPDGQKLVTESTLNITPPALAGNGAPIEPPLADNEMPNRGWTRASMTTRAALAQQRLAPQASREQSVGLQPNLLAPGGDGSAVAGEESSEPTEPRSPRDNADPAYRTARGRAPQWQPYR